MATFSPLAEFFVRSLSINTWLVFVILGIITSVSYLYLVCNELKLKFGLVLDLFIVVILCLAVGGRIGFYILNPGIYDNNLLWLLRIWDGNTTIWAGALFAAFELMLFSIKKKVNLFTILDALIPPLLVFSIFIRLGNFISGFTYGAPSNLPTAIAYTSLSAHPTDLYFILSTTVILIFIHIYRRVKGRLKYGEVSALALLAYSFFASGIDLFQNFNATWMLYVNQIFFGIVFVLAVYIFYKKELYLKNTPA